MALGAVHLTSLYYGVWYTAPAVLLMRHPYLSEASARAPHPPFQETPVARGLRLPGYCRFRSGPTSW
ncbi:hypothetical protein GCM10023097_77570 [Streptomyces collinus]|uniref:Uncharacterized protein n=1 Tax=Streptomyces collinus TaxID=42684 RepID=A0AA89QK15_STRCU|nr:hypothetical protein [Streptomyces collinus]